MTPTTAASPPNTGTAADGGGDLAGQAQEKLKEGAETAKEQAANVTQQAQAKAREQIEGRTTEAGERVKSTAGDARSMAEHLRSEGKDGPARLVEQAADRAEGLGSYLAEADTDRMIRDVERYARSNPWAVIAGGLALGFAASRVVSASSASRGIDDRPQPRHLNAPTTPSPTYSADAGRADGADLARSVPTDRPPATADLPNYGGSPG